MSEECIKSAAIQAYDGTVYTKGPPARHTDIVYLMAQQGLLARDTLNQGFLTNKDRFIGRIEAKAIALSANQVKDFSKLHSTDLFTEDLW